MSRVVTLTTDFGEGSCYVAAMKGVILATAPDATLHDLSHRIPPQNLRYAAVFLRGALPFFPPGTIHVVVVDPGVGTKRDILCVEWREQILLVPDNGCWTSLEAIAPVERAFRLSRPELWREQVSHTFHGRDVFAPVAGHLAKGMAPHAVGEPTSEWIRLDLPQAEKSESGIRGEVIFVDDFGNLISNIPGDWIRESASGIAEVAVESRPVGPLVATYGEAEPGRPVALISSFDTLEVAVNHGSAAAALDAKVGTPVTVALSK